MLNPAYTADNLRLQIYGENMAEAVERCNDALAIMFEEGLEYVEIVDFSSETALMLASDLLIAAGFVVDTSSCEGYALEVSI